MNLISIHVTYYCINVLYARPHVGRSYMFQESRVLLFREFDLVSHRRTPTSDSSSTRIEETMDRTSQWLLSAVLLAAAPRTTARASRSAPAKPNIVLFLTDDQDVQLGGWTPMRFANKALIERGGGHAADFLGIRPRCALSSSESAVSVWHCGCDVGVIWQ